MLDDPQIVRTGSASSFDPATAADYFGAISDSYDSLIRRAVPRYQEMQERLIEFMPDRASSVLELGCGTGHLTAALLQRFPEAEWTVVDASPEMLEATRARLASASQGQASRFRFVESRFEDLDVPPDRFDLVASSISLHHVLDKAALFARIHDWLRPQGWFCFADQMRGGTDRAHAIHWERWLAFCRQGCTKEEIEGLVQHAEAHDHYVSLADHFSALRGAGLVRLDCPWRNGMWGIVTAQA